MLTQTIGQDGKTEIMEGRTNEKKFTMQGRDTPVPLGVVGERVGPTRPSSIDYLEVSTRRHVGSAGNNTGGQESPVAGIRGEIGHPRSVNNDHPEGGIRRISALRRTPLKRSRAHSLPEVRVLLPWEDENDSIVVGETEKKKRQKKSPKQAVKRPEENKEKVAETKSQKMALPHENWKELRRKISEVSRVVIELRKHVKENVNTKLEIKATTTKLSLYKCAHTASFGGGRHDGGRKGS